MFNVTRAIRAFFVTGQFEVFLSELRQRSTFWHFHRLWCSETDKINILLINYQHTACARIYESMELSIGRIFITIWLIAYIHGNFPFLTPHHTRRKQQFSRFNRETTIDLANVSLLFPFLPPYNMLSAMSRCGSILSLLPRFTCVFW